MREVADFEIIRELGRGGMGVVYEAIEKPLGRRVALKLLHPQWATRQDGSERFIDEARKIARLSHPSIVKIHRFGQVDDTYYLALELVNGLPLDIILSQERITIEQVLTILMQVAEALAHAHESAIVHRDIKPGNIFLQKDSKVVIGDFGIAKDLREEGNKLTQTGAIVGTPAYMSPEQAQGQSITPAADIYALGVVAFEMVTGRVPFTADTAISLLLKHVNEPPPLIYELVNDVPAALVRLIEQMLEKHPARRPRNGRELAQMLAQVQREISQDTNQTQPLNVRDLAPNKTQSSFDEIEVAVACFKLVDFSTDTSQNLLPARVAFLLESWYRLVRLAVEKNGGLIDRYVGGKVTTVFGFPQRRIDDVQRALRTARELQHSLQAFNRAHDLQLRMHAGIACGPALIGNIVGDVGEISVQGLLMRDMMKLSRTKLVDETIRLTRAAYRRSSDSGKFKSFEEPIIGQAWALLEEQ